MQVAKAMDIDSGMVVKRLSVPLGLEELMESLTKQVLLKKPKDIYIFASEYFEQLLKIRDQECSRAGTHQNISNTRRLVKQNRLKDDISIRTAMVATKFQKIPAATPIIFTNSKSTNYLTRKSSGTNHNCLKQNSEPSSNKRSQHTSTNTRTNLKDKPQKSPGKVVQKYWKKDDVAGSNNFSNKNKIYETDSARRRFTNRRITNAQKEPQKLPAAKNVKEKEVITNSNKEKNQRSISSQRGSSRSSTATQKSNTRTSKSPLKNKTLPKSTSLNENIFLKGAAVNLENKVNKSKSMRSLDNAIISILPLLPSDDLGSTKCDDDCICGINTKSTDLTSDITSDKVIAKDETVDSDFEEGKDTPSIDKLSISNGDDDNSEKLYNEEVKFKTESMKNGFEECKEHVVIYKEETENTLKESNQVAEDILENILEKSNELSEENINDNIENSLGIYKEALKNFSENDMEASQTLTQISNVEVIDNDDKSKDILENVENISGRHKRELSDDIETLELEQSLEESKEVDNLVCSPIKETDETLNEDDKMQDIAHLNEGEAILLIETQDNLDSLKPLDKTETIIETKASSKPENKEGSPTISSETLNIDVEPSTPIEDDRLDNNIEEENRTEESNNANIEHESNQQDLLKVTEEENFEPTTEIIEDVPNTTENSEDIKTEETSNPNLQSLEDLHTTDDHNSDKSSEAQIIEDIVAQLDSNDSNLNAVEENSNNIEDDSQINSENQETKEESSARDSPQEVIETSILKVNKIELGKNAIQPSEDIQIEASEVPIEEIEAALRINENIDSQINELVENLETTPVLEIENISINNNNATDENVIITDEIIGNNLNDVEEITKTVIKSEKEFNENNINIPAGVTNILNDPIGFISNNLEDETIVFEDYTLIDQEDTENPNEAPIYSDEDNNSILKDIDPKNQDAKILNHERTEEIEEKQVLSNKIDDTENKSENKMSLVEDPIKDEDNTTNIVDNSIINNDINIEDDKINVRNETIIIKEDTSSITHSLEEEEIKNSKILLSPEEIIKIDQSEDNLISNNEEQEITTEETNPNINKENAFEVINEDIASTTEAEIHMDGVEISPTSDQLMNNIDQETGNFKDGVQEFSNIKETETSMIPTFQVEDDDINEKSIVTEDSNNITDIEIISSDATNLKQADIEEVEDDLGHSNDIQPASEVSDNITNDDTEVNISRLNSTRTLEDLTILDSNITTTLAKTPDTFEELEMIPNNSIPSIKRPDGIIDDGPLVLEDVSKYLTEQEINETNNFLEHEKIDYSSERFDEQLISNNIQEELGTMSSSGVTRNNLELEELSAIKIQSLWKGFLTRKQYRKNIETVEETNLDKAATVIQALFRGCMIRKLMTNNNSFYKNNPSEDLGSNKNYEDQKKLIDGPKFVETENEDKLAKDAESSLVDTNDMEMKINDDKVIISIEGGETIGKGEDLEFSHIDDIESINADNKVIIEEDIDDIKKNNDNSEDFSIVNEKCISPPEDFKAGDEENVEELCTVVDNDSTPKEEGNTLREVGETIIKIEENVEELCTVVDNDSAVEEEGKTSELVGETIKKIKENIEELRTVVDNDFAAEEEGKTSEEVGQTVLKIEENIEELRTVVDNDFAAQEEGKTSGKVEETITKIEEIAEEDKESSKFSSDYKKSEEENVEKLCSTLDNDSGSNIEDTISENNQNNNIKPEELHIIEDREFIPLSSESAKIKEENLEELCTSVDILSLSSVPNKISENEQETEIIDEEIKEPVRSSSNCEENEQETINKSHTIVDNDFSSTVDGKLSENDKENFQLHQEEVTEIENEENKKSTSSTEVKEDNLRIEVDNDLEKTTEDNKESQLRNIHDLPSIVTEIDNNIISVVGDSEEKPAEEIKIEENAEELLMSSVDDPKKNDIELPLNKSEDNLDQTDKIDKFATEDNETKHLESSKTLGTEEIKENLDHVDLEEEDNSIIEEIMTKTIIQHSRSESSKDANILEENLATIKLEDTVNPEILEISQEDINNDQSDEDKQETEIKIEESRDNKRDSQTATDNDWNSLETIIDGSDLSEMNSLDPTENEAKDLISQIKHDLNHMRNLMVSKDDDLYDDDVFYEDPKEEPTKEVRKKTSKRGSQDLEEEDHDEEFIRNDKFLGLMNEEEDKILPRAIKRKLIQTSASKIQNYYRRYRDRKHEGNLLNDINDNMTVDDKSALITLDNDNTSHTNEENQLSGGYNTANDLAENKISNEANIDETTIDDANEAIVIHDDSEFNKLIDAKIEQKAAAKIQRNFRKFRMRQAHNSFFGKTLHEDDSDLGNKDEDRKNYVLTNEDNTSFENNEVLTGNFNHGNANENEKQANVINDDIANEETDNINQKDENNIGESKIENDGDVIQNSGNNIDIEDQNGVTKDDSVNEDNLRKNSSDEKVKVTLNADSIDINDDKDLERIIDRKIKNKAASKIQRNFRRYAARVAHKSFFDSNEDDDLKLKNDEADIINTDEDIGTESIINDENDKNNDIISKNDETENQPKLSNNNNDDSKDESSKKESVDDLEKNQLDNPTLAEMNDPAETNEESIDGVNDSPSNNLVIQETGNKDDDKGTEFIIDANNPIIIKRIENKAASKIQRNFRRYKMRKARGSFFDDAVDDDAQPAEEIIENNVVTEPEDKPEDIEPKEATEILSETEPTNVPEELEKNIATAALILSMINNKAASKIQRNYRRYKMRKNRSSFFDNTIDEDDNDELVKSLNQMSLRSKLASSSINSKLGKDDANDEDSVKNELSVNISDNDTSKDLIHDSSIDLTEDCQDVATPKVPDGDVDSKVIDKASSDIPTASSDIPEISKTPTELPDSEIYSCDNLDEFVTKRSESRSAIKIQRAFKRYKAKQSHNSFFKVSDEDYNELIDKFNKKSMDNKTDISELIMAAVKIQKMFKGYLARKDFNTLKQAKVIDENKSEKVQPFYLHDSSTNFDNPIAVAVQVTSKKTNQEPSIALLHSGEFHDSLPLDVSSTEVLSSESALNRTSESPTLLHSGELHDGVLLPGADAAGQVFVIIQVMRE